MITFNYLTKEDYAEIRKAVGNLLDGSGGFLNNNGHLSTNRNVSELASQLDEVKYWMAIEARLSPQEILDHVTDMLAMKTRIRKEMLSALKQTEEQCESLERLVDTVNTGVEMSDKKIELFKRILQWQEEEG